MSLFMSGHAVVLNKAALEVREADNDLLHIRVEEEHSQVLITVSVDVAEDLVRRLEAYLMDRQLRAHPETVPGLVQIDKE